MQALLELDCIPAGMELFPAADEDQWSLIRKVIDDCDYYIVIVGGRYGSVTNEGISYTQMEYDYAVSKNKPVIGFLHKDVGSISSKKVEKTDTGKQRLEAFRQLVQKKHCKYWSSADELGSVVSRSLIHLIKTKPAVGWVRANLVPDESAVQEILTLRRRIDELEQAAIGKHEDPIPGAEKLARGEERFTLTYSFTVQDDLYRSLSHRRQINLTWNRLFYLVSPLMIESANEPSLNNALARGLPVHDGLRREFEGARQIKDTRITDESFHTIMIQFKALGLIEKVERKRTKDTQLEWTLTPYGDRLMTQLRAVQTELVGTPSLEGLVEAKNAATTHNPPK